MDMDAVSLTVIFKGFGMLLVIGGGIQIGWYGYRLYIDGAGVGRDKAGFEVGTIKIQAHSVGSVVMATAFLWAWAGVTLSPNLDKSGENIRIYSFVTPSGEITAPEITAKVKDPPTLKQDDPTQLKVLLLKAVSGSGTRKLLAEFEVNGSPAVIDLSSVDVSRRYTGDYFISATLSTKGGGTKVNFAPRFKVNFVPRISHGIVTFVPSSVEKIDEGRLNQ